MKTYFLELLLTRKCNKSCNYCNVYQHGKNDNLEIDLDFINYILNKFPDNLTIELSGGEPGVVSNIDDVFLMLRSHNKVKKIQIMSNGLIRKLNKPWFDQIDYYKEHLIENINDGNIDKFYDLNFDFSFTNVIITTPEIVRSFIAHYDDLKFLITKNTWFKLLNPKTYNIYGYLDDLKLFSKKLNIVYDSLNKNKYAQKLCNVISPHVFIDCQTKEICHCGILFEKSSRFDANEDNINKHINRQLFQNNSYCTECHNYMNIKSSISILSSNNFNKIINK